MKVLIIRDSNGHFKAVKIENEKQELKALQDLMHQICHDQETFSDECCAEAYRLAHMGTIQSIKQWMNDGLCGLAMGRSGGGRIEIVECMNEIPPNFAREIVL